MKLTAPPPPPPEPPEPPEPGAGGEPGPEKRELQAEAAGEPDVKSESAEQPQPQPEPKPATWPAWFAGFDVALAGVAIVIGFLAASFAARNSDLWIHLGAGRMLTTGEYMLGSDPLSYTAADRTWVNHSWLFDLGSFGLYSLDDNGFALVLAKAAAVAATLLLLIAIRREGQPLWPWAVFAALAVLAAAPRFTLSPMVGSAFFLALTLFLVFRVPNPPGSWRLPIAIGVAFWFWANTDSWFILGPIAIALLLIGEVIRGRSAGSGEAADALLPLPDVKTLTRALVIGIVACMLNPHHIGVWQLPVEISATLFERSTFAADPELRPALVSPLAAEFWGNSMLGYNLNGLAYAVLLLSGIYAIALTGPIGRFLGPPADIDPLPLPHTILWCTFAGLSLLTAAAIPFLAIVTVPLVASRFNLLSSRVTLGDWNDRKTRLVLTGSAAGRVASLAVLIVLGLIAWPGWLHPPGLDSPPGWFPSQARQVAWAVEPDAALVEAAKQFQQWRETGDLPAESHGILSSLELADYCAWFAPGEKVFANSRLQHHRAELPDFLKLRSGLQLFPQNEPGDPADAREVLTRRGSEYLALTATRTDPADIRERVQQTTNGLWRSWARWSPWAIHGRTAVLGWRPDPDRGSPRFDRLRLDSVQRAFGPGVERLPAGQVQPPPPPREWIDDFFRPVPPPPPGAYEAIAWLLYKHELKMRQAEHYQLRYLLLRNGPGGAPSLLANLYQAQAVELYRGGNSPYLPPRKGSAEEGSLLAVPIIALRTAWRAIADNPDHPDGYFALAQALEDRELPLGEDERMLAMITAYRQCLSRLPPPQDYRPGIYTASPTQVAQTLTFLYLNPDGSGNFRGVPVTMPGLRELGGEMLVVQGRNMARVPTAAEVNLPPDARIVGGPFVLPLDLALGTVVLAQEYASREFASESAERREQRAKGMENQRKSIEKVLTEATNRYRSALERPQIKLRDRYYIARTLGLVGEAIATLRGMKEGEMGREFGADAPRVALEQIALELVCGRLDDASADLADLKAGFDTLAQQSPPPPGLDQLQFVLRRLEYRKLILEGNYAAAGREWEAVEGGIVRVQFKPELDKATTWPFDKLQNHWVIIPTLGATDGPLGVLGRLMLAQTQLQHYMGMRQEIQSVLEQKAVFFYQRGFLSLLEGDVASARERFRQSLEECKPPPGHWGLTNPRLPAAVDYLRLIDRARETARQ